MDWYSNFRDRNINQMEVQTMDKKLNRILAVSYTHLDVYKRQVYGGAIGALVPVLSFMMAGMPAVPKLYFMVVELLGYGILSGILSKRCHIYAGLIGAMAGGRLLYGAALAVGAKVFNLHAPFVSMSAFAGGIITGIPGMIIQVVLVPVLIYGLRKGGFTFD